MDETNTSQTKADETKNTTQKQWTQAINTNSPDHTKVKQIQAKPDEPLEEGFEWTDEYYDPDRIGEPGYREKVMKHLHAKHYYESPQRQMPPFKESRALLKQWKVEPSMENIVLVHDTAVEWHRNLYYAERESGPAAGPETRERVDFMTEFKKKSIRGRFDDIFGIKDNAFMEALVEIKP
ncbi:MAG: hypothetical protein HOH33_12775, partial [Verrucomicrobia bacterium]|nr:hypothetical protein [Verrucomicrobiota bacterium]